MGCTFHSVSNFVASVHSCSEICSCWSTEITRNWSVLCETFDVRIFPFFFIFLFFFFRLSHRSPYVFFHSFFSPQKHVLLFVWFQFLANRCFYLLLLGTRPEAWSVPCVSRSVAQFHRSGQHLSLASHCFTSREKHWTPQRENFMMKVLEWVKVLHYRNEPR